MQAITLPDLNGVEFLLCSGLLETPANISPSRERCPCSRQLARGIGDIATTRQKSTHGGASTTFKDVTMRSNERVQVTLLGRKSR